jgi:hypothetical protein
MFGVNLAAGATLRLVALGAQAQRSEGKTRTDG